MTVWCSGTIGGMESSLTLPRPGRTDSSSRARTHSPLQCSCARTTPRVHCRSIPFDCGSASNPEIPVSKEQVCRTSPCKCLVKPSTQNNPIYHLGCAGDPLVDNQMHSHTCTLAVSGRLIGTAMIPETESLKVVNLDRVLAAIRAKFSRT